MKKIPGNPCLKHPAAFDSVDAQIAGLGRIDAVKQLYVDHTKAAIDSLGTEAATEDEAAEAETAEAETEAAARIRTIWIKKSARNVTELPGSYFERRLIK